MPSGRNHGGKKGGRQDATKTTRRNNHRRRCGRQEHDSGSNNSVAAPLVMNKATTQWKPPSLHPNYQTAAATTTNQQSSSRSSSRSSSSSSDEEATQTRRRRRLVGLLNKLTPTNFNVLVAAYLNQEISADAALHDYSYATARAIVDRAAGDARFGPMYAALCQRLAAAQGVVSTTALWQYCCDATDLQGHHTPTVDATASLQRRQVYLGTLRFIGHLVQAHVLHVQQGLEAVQRLMEQSHLMNFVSLELQNESSCGNQQDDNRHHDDCNNEIQQVPLEGLIVLLTTCGQALEGTVTSFECLQQCWHGLQALVMDDDDDDNNNNNNSQHAAVPRLPNFRMRHLVQELLELRATAWQATRPHRALVAQPLLPADRVRPRGRHQQRRRRGVRFATHTTAAATSATTSSVDNPANYNGT